jgi:hypothetical protein
MKMGLLAKSPQAGWTRSVAATGSSRLASLMGAGHEQKRPTGTNKTGAYQSQKSGVPNFTIKHCIPHFGL